MVMFLVHEVWPKPSCKAQWKGEKTRRTKEEVGRQHQGMGRPGVRQVPEGNWEQGKMEKTFWKIISGAPTILAVKGLIMMMMMMMMNSTVCWNALTLSNRSRITEKEFWGTSKQFRTLMQTYAGCRPPVVIHCVKLFRVRIPQYRVLRCCDKHPVVRHSRDVIPRTGSIWLLRKPHAFWSPSTLTFTDLVCLICKTDP